MLTQTTSSKTYSKGDYKRLSDRIRKNPNNIESSDYEMLQALRLTYKDSLAVREAFTNAVIHADVFMPGGVLRIDKYDDRLVLRNPGTLRLPIEKIYEGGTSRARNPHIQNMLRMIGYGENLGSGFPMIMNAWKAAGWGEPVLKNQIDLDEVELSLPVKASGSTTQKTTQKIREMMKANSEISIEELAVACGITRDGVNYHIRNLKKNNIIRRIGGDKGGHWEIIED